MTDDPNENAPVIETAPFDGLATINRNLVQYIKLVHAQEARRERRNREDARAIAYEVRDLTEATRDQTAYFRQADREARAVTIIPYELSDARDTRGFWARVFNR